MQGSAMKNSLLLLSLALLLQCPVQSQPQYQNYQPQGGAPVGGEQFSNAQRPATDPAMIKRWFASYDQVRRQAQMTPSERQQADGLMSRGLSMFVPGEEKLAGQKLLNSLVAKYSLAIDQMKQLPLFPETEQLHRGYYQYFSDARALFSDYLKVQNDPLAKDPNTGERLLGKVLQRKVALTELEGNVKNLDSELRNRLGLAPYRY